MQKLFLQICMHSLQTFVNFWAKIYFAKTVQKIQATSAQTLQKNSAIKHFTLFVENSA